jgi:hypothetical protein
MAYHSRILAKLLQLESPFGGHDEVIHIDSYDTIGEWGSD